MQIVECHKSMESKLHNANSEIGLYIMPQLALSSVDGTRNFLLGVAFIMMRKRKGTEE